MKRTTEIGWKFTYKKIENANISDWATRTNALENWCPFKVSRLLQWNDAWNEIEDVQEGEPEREMLRMENRFRTVIECV